MDKIKDQNIRISSHDHVYSVNDYVFDEIDDILEERQREREPNIQQERENEDALQILQQIVGWAQTVYDVLGSGHSEIVYHRAFEVELRNNNISYSTKAPITLKYKGVIVGYSEPDIIIHLSDNGNDNDIIVELKATTYAPRAQEKAQLHSYMRSTGISRGILINFPQPSSKNNMHQTHGIHFLPFGFEDQTDFNNSNSFITVPEPPKYNLLDDPGVVLCNLNLINSN